MSLIEQLDQDLTTSMKEGVASRTAVLRLIKSSLKNEQIKLGHELTEPETLKVLQREAKQRKDSIQQFNDAGRTDLAESEEHELEIIQSYLPQQMTEAELSQLVDQVATDTNATSPAEMGVVIGAVMQQAAGRADGAMVARLVKQRLQ
jgi:uncharacterized protein YqeY